MRLVLEMPYGTESMNRWKHHRFAARDRRRQWEKRINDAILLARSETGRREVWHRPPQCKVRVQIERFAPQADALDHDRFNGGLVPLLDAMKALQLIDDDNAKSIDVIAEQKANPYSTPGRWTRITMEEATR